MTIMESNLQSEITLHIKIPVHILIEKDIFVKLLLNKWGTSAYFLCVEVPYLFRSTNKEEIT